MSKITNISAVEMTPLPSKLMYKELGDKMVDKCMRCVDDARILPRVF